MTNRAPGTRRNKGLALMAVGALLLLVFSMLSLGEVTTAVARVSGVVFIVGIATLVAGLVLYGLARANRI